MSSLPLSVSVVVPCFDEERRIGATIAELCRVLESLDPPSWEVLVVDDHSTDRTAEIVRAASVTHQRVRLLASADGKGKGAAVRTGALAAVHDAVLVVDADLAGDLAAVPRMCELLTDADAVLGSRLLPGAVLEPSRTVRRRGAAWVFRTVVRVATPLRVSDPQCGFKMFRREPLQRHARAMSTTGYAYEVELLVRLAQSGAVLVDLPITWREGHDSKVRVGRDGVEMVREVWSARRPR